MLTRCLPTVPAPFRVEVATVHTSAARVPNDESVRVVLAHTAVGIVATRDEEAVSTVALVLLLIVVIAEAIVPAVETVPAVIAEARDEEALDTRLLVPPMSEPTDVDAASIDALVLLLTAV